MRRAVCACIAVWFAALPQLQGGDAPAKPNILFVCVDDLKPALGCYGDTHARTPNVDRLAARSVRFERAYCNQAVCAPSRNSLMTGLRPQTLGIYDLGTNFRAARPDAVTMAQHFRKHGYKTQAMGKVFHVGHGNHEDNASWDLPHFQAKTVDYTRPENKANLSREEALFANKGEAWKLPRGAATESAEVPDETYGDGKIANEAVKRLQSAAKDGQPFFMAVGFLKPHLPFVAPKKYWDLHDPAKLPHPERQTPPDGAPAYAPQFGGELRNYADMPAGNKPLDAKVARHLIHGYYAAASYMDAQLGRVLDALRETGLEKNTIVVLWGDHGWHLGDHGMWCKHTNYEQAGRIPLLLAMPGKNAGAEGVVGQASLPAGTVSGIFVETVDLYPTLAELAGLPAPEGLDGKSFAASLANPEKPHRSHVIHVYPRGNRLGRAIRTERYRLVEWKVPGADPASAELELYDYQDDPGETKNFARQKPEVVKDVRALLAAHPEAKPQLKVPPKPARP